MDTSSSRKNTHAFSVERPVSYEYDAKALLDLLCRGRELHSLGYLSRLVAMAPLTLHMSLVLVASAFSATTAQWTQLWEVDTSSEVLQPARRSAHAAIILDDFMYVYGGIGYSTSGDDEEYNDTWAFDLKYHTWTQLNQPTTLPAAGPGTRFHVSGALHTNASASEFIIFGGVSIAAAITPDGTAKPTKFSTTSGIPVAQFNDVWRLVLNPTELDNSEVWAQDPIVNSNDTMPTARSESGIATLGDQLLVFGGISYDPPSDHGDLWSYDLSTFMWTQVVPASTSAIPPSRFSHSVTIFESGTTSYFLVFSGRHLNTQSDAKSSWRVLDDLWLFDFSSKLWTIVTPSGADVPPRAYTSIVSIGSSMWFFAGYYRPPQSASGYVFDDVVRGAIEVNTDTSNNTNQLPISASVDVEVAVLNSEAPTLRYNHAAALWRNDCMVIFGGSYQIPRGDVWVLNVSQTETREPAAAALSRLPMGVETLVYVLGGFILTIIVALLVLIVRWRRIDRQNVRSLVID